MSEYWIEVKGHPRYLVSTMGRVKCLDWKRTGKERICRSNDNGKGYLQVAIDGVKKYVHRLVLKAFIPNPEKKPCADHINTNRADCRVENLRWVSHKENCNNPISKKHHSENAATLGKFGAEHPKSISIVQFTRDWQFIRKWPAAKEVERELGINNSCIIQCCKGKQKTAGGYKWMYATDYNPVNRSISDIRPLF